MQLEENKYSNRCIEVSLQHSLETPEKNDSSDGFIVNAETFIDNFEFFLPRRSKTIVIGTNFPGIKRQDITRVESNIRGPFIVGANESLEIFSECVDKVLKEKTADPIPSGALSGREKEVLKEIASGMTNKEIADKLSISVNTVITHRKNISTKLGIKTVSGLSLYALMNGVI